MRSKKRYSEGASMALHDYERLLTPARERFALSPGVRAIQANRDEAFLESFFAAFLRAWVAGWGRQERAGFSAPMEELQTGDR
jgi:hypothetical protein